MAITPPPVLLNPLYETLLKNYAHFIDTLGYVPQTNCTRKKIIERLLQWLQDNADSDIQAITATHLNKYIQTLKERLHRFKGIPISLKTVVHEQTTIAHFFTYLQQSGSIKNNPAGSLQAIVYDKSSNRKSLTSTQIKQLYAAADTLQQCCILSLAYGCGLRLAEVSALNTGDIKLVEKILIVQKGKGNKRRVIPLSKTVAADINYYQLYERAHVNETALLLNAKHKRLQKHSIAGIMRMLSGRSGVKGCSLHLLRHSIATHLLQQGMPIEQVRYFLGHAQLETTQIYTHVNSQQLHTNK